MEVSMPTGSLCAERNVIGSALADDVTLLRKDIKIVAVYSFPNIDSHRHHHHPPSTHTQNQLISHFQFPASPLPPSQSSVHHLDNNSDSEQQPNKKFKMDTERIDRSASETSEMGDSYPSINLSQQHEFTPAKSPVSKRKIHNMKLGSDNSASSLMAPPQNSSPFSEPRKGINKRTPVNFIQKSVLFATPALSATPHPMEDNERMIEEGTEENNNGNGNYCSTNPISTSKIIVADPSDLNPMKVKNGFLLYFCCYFLNLFVFLFLFSALWCLQ
jgi:hypothetical protein